MNTQQVLARLDAAWVDFEGSYAGLSNAQLHIPGITGQWSVRDIIAHVTWWMDRTIVGSTCRSMLGVSLILVGPD